MKKLLCVLSLIVCSQALAQKPHNPSSSEILQRLNKLNFLGTVLYVAAHPDDENTRMIAYLSNERLANTAYLSLTRGDGGQNLIGPEIREGLGMIRTQELLAARRIDGGQQFFSRANDFGYSKSTVETQKIWDRDKVLEDVVWTYRTFKPDVIITRFPPDKRAGHGHHTTSAVFAEEAFELSGDEKVYPSHLKHTTTWQPKRLYLNTGRWWNRDINENTPGVLMVDVGEYNELLGTSYTELAARSRSQHKSQGFGSTGRRGSSLEFLELQAGDRAEKDIFEGVDTSWGRVEGGANIEQMINTIIAKYDPAEPSAIVTDLLDVRDEITLLNDDYWKPRKIKEIDQIIKGALGLYLETKAVDFMASPGESVSVQVETINRSKLPVKIEMVSFDHLKDTLTSETLVFNRNFSFESNITLPESWDYSDPYWLKEAGTLGTYKVDDLMLRGTPENKAAVTVRYSLDIAGTKIIYESPLIYKWNDPVGGELYRPFVIAPPVFINIPESVYIFNGDQPKSIEITVKNTTNSLNGAVSLDLPKGWTSSPVNHQLELSKRGEEKVVKFDVQPSSEQPVGELKANVVIDGRKFTKSLQVIEYDHIPTQTLMPEARARVVRMDIKKVGDRIAYITGAGDAIPASLREIGYEVIEMNEYDVSAESISEMDAVVLGIRALNTNDRADFYMPILLDYVNAGGTLVTQYNTSRRLKTDNFSPYPLTLSRDRVAEEDAAIEILAPEHPVMNTPNKLSSKDFENWVQERGLYFPNEWSEEYTAILSSHDTNETDKEGGLLVAPYGKGYYVYSGYSFFRQLPAGVPGAFRLFVNLVSLRQDAGKKGKKSRKQDSE